MVRPIPILLAAFAVPLLAIPALAILDQGVGDLDTDEAVDEANRQLDETGGDYAPAPPGSDPDPGIIDIGRDLGQVMAENWALTGVVTVGIVAVAITGWVLSSRFIDPRIALRNPQRSMLYGFVKGNPGVHLKQLSVEFRMKTSTVLWHVRKLEAADLVRSKKSNGYRVFYPVSGGLEARQMSEAVTALSNENARRIFDAIRQNPGVPQRVLTDALQINAGTVRWHLKKLGEAGLLQEMGTSRTRTYLTTELGERALRQVQGAPQVVQTTPVVPTPGQAVAVVTEEPVVFG